MKSKTKLQSLFNILLFSFLMIVPLIPIKIRLGLIPVSADFLFGSSLIIVGTAHLLLSKGDERKQCGLFNGRMIRVFAGTSLMVLLISLVSIGYATNTTAALTETLRFVEYIAIFVLIVMIVDHKTIDRSFKIFYFTMAFACVFGIAQIFFNWSKFLAGGFLGKERIYATFVNPNYWGAALNLVVFYPIISIMDKKRELKFDLLFLVLFLVNLLFCSTRSAWIGFLFGLVVIFVVKYRKSMLGLAAIIGLSALIPSIRDRFSEPLYLTERINIWKTGLAMFQDNWLAGVGTGGYIYRYKEYMRSLPELVQRKPQYSTHSSYVKMFAELGAVGGFFFATLYLMMLGIAAQAYRSSLRYRAYALAMLGFGTAYLLQNLFNNLVFVPQLNVFVWIVTALLYKGAWLAKQNN